MLKKEFSIYLDLVRFSAAVLVVVNHSNHREIITSLLPQLGHSAVMIFFVLSGFVIAYVTNTRETNLRAYSISRIARLYSVIPVALVVTLLADYIGQTIDPVFYQRGGGAHDYWLLRLFSSFFLLNEIWNISITTYSNVPYWSLNYEAWYYIMFGMVMFMRDRARIIMLSVTVLFLGPKILLLAPIWLLGVYLYHSRYFGSLSERTGWIFFIGSLILIWLFHAFGIREICGAWLKQLVGAYYYRELAYSKSFLSDYLLAILVFANFAGFRAICERFSAVLLPSASIIKYLAGYTFVLYLTHQPLIWLFKIVIDGDPSTPLFLFQIWTMVALITWLLGQITERRKSSYLSVAALLVDQITRLKRGVTRSRIL